MDIQTALADVLEKYGQTDYKGRRFASIPLHRFNDYPDLNPVLLHLPYRRDDTGTIKYEIRNVDEIHNLHVWKDAEK